MRIRQRWSQRVFISSALLACLATATTRAADEYGELVRKDDPVAWWRMSADQAAERITNAAGSDEAQLSGRLAGSVRPGQEGPMPARFPLFSNASRAAAFDGRSASIRVADEESGGALKFTNGDEITMEAWVRPRSVGSVAYVIGKGRTRQGGFGDRNQNYSLRLVRRGGLAHLSFFFCDAVADEAARKKKQDGHRWTSQTGFPLDGDWRHIAVVYRFGDPESIQGYINGVPVDGKWDLGGPTQRPPVVDDDELWIGASMGGNSGVFHGDIAEVAVYNSILPETRLQRRYQTTGERPAGRAVGEVDAESIPTDAVRVTLTEYIPASRNWKFAITSAPTRSWESDRFAFTDVPHKYTEKGLIADYSLPYLLTAASRIRVSADDAGKHEVVLRALSAARLFVDGELMAETPFQSLARSGHGALHKLKPPQPGLLSLPAAHSEQQFSLDLAPGEHTVVLEAIIGHPGRVPRVGELAVGIARPGESSFQVLSPNKSIPFNDAEWLAFLEQEEQRLEAMNRAERSRRGREEAEWWERRHQLAREFVLQTSGPEVPEVQNAAAVNNEIDRFIQHRLEAEEVEPAPLVDDLAFLRRVTLDVVGVIPSEEEVQKYLADPPEVRKERVVDRLLEDPRWADHWVSYWQDVLAENVGLAKPTLNNTGPFRFFIHSAFRDNKPIDRFATELTLMEGSRYSGGPAGFGVATQNDVPMAAKAHVLGTAFLGVEMKCARCHDAPMHDVRQEDLFSLAAMLARKSQKVPESSSVPGTPEQLREMLIEVSLEPGSEVSPDWPFGEFISTTINELPAEAIRHPNDPREQLALLMTWPANERFARVIANRLWKRYFGRGLAEPVHDFEYAELSHPTLLDHLARELVLNEYDLKYLARLILNSQAYQREIPPPDSDAVARPELFAAALERRLTAEQIVDSLHAAAGKQIDSEELTLDRDGRQKVEEFVSLGFPERAWELAAASNERDRPSTIWPKVQSLVDLLAAFGWRQSRPDPITERQNATTPLTPMMLAHGAAANRVIDMSDDSGITRLSLEEQPVEQLVDRLFMRFLTREPDQRERRLLTELLSVGYEERVVAGPEAVPSPKIHRSPRSWSNNLRADANEIAIRAQHEALQGDPPTRRLDPEWRMRMEEAVWTLANLPEFVFAP